jgi:hypothetical protein
VLGGLGGPGGGRSGGVRGPGDARAHGKGGGEVDGHQEGPGAKLCTEEIWMSVASSRQREGILSARAASRPKRAACWPIQLPTIFDMYLRRTYKFPSLFFEWLLHFANEKRMEVVLSHGIPWQSQLTADRTIE